MSGQRIIHLSSILHPVRTIITKQSQCLKFDFIDNVSTPSTLQCIDYKNCVGGWGTTRTFWKFFKNVVAIVLLYLYDYDHNLHQNKINISPAANSLSNLLLQLELIIGWRKCDERVAEVCNKQYNHQSLRFKYCTK